jgi:hypothetical protein
MKKFPVAVEPKSFHCKHKSLSFIVVIIHEHNLLFFVFRALADKKYMNVIFVQIASLKAAAYEIS